MAQSDDSIAGLLQAATEYAAATAAHCIQNGDEDHLEDRARESMAVALAKIPGATRLVLGGGDAGSTTLVDGALLGRTTDSDPSGDLAIDPAEGTTFLQPGLTNAMAVAALVEPNGFMNPGPALYMEKLVLPPEARGKVDPSASVPERLQQLSDALRKPVARLTVYVLEKTRHNALIDAVRSAGASVALYPAGDIAGALLAGAGGGDIDALMGTGGVPEGFLAAAAVKCLGGEFLGRMDPQLPSEHAAMRAEGRSTTQWHDQDKLVPGYVLGFSATGITSGLLLSGATVQQTEVALETLTLSSGRSSWEKQPSILSAWPGQEGPGGA
ncbi:fructose-bisphosphatase class II [Coralliovum pocilloporae]|uniref:fructose-bisphosphatase class II n=1 Tax=Coralliovum pocilloporae TaxID=3066369 RepID=UPI0033071F80